MADVDVTLAVMKAEVAGPGGGSVLAATLAASVEVLAARDEVVPLADQVIADAAAVTLARANVAVDRAQTGLDRAATAADREIALTAATTASQAVGSVANAAIARDTLAQLIAVTGSPQWTLGTVNADPPNNGTYRWNGSAWERISTATVLSLDTRAVSLEASLFTGQESRNWVGGYRLGNRLAWAIRAGTGQVLIPNLQFGIPEAQSESRYLVILGHSDRIIVGMDRVTGRLRLALDAAALADINAQLGVSVLNARTAGILQDEAESRVLSVVRDASGRIVYGYDARTGLAALRPDAATLAYIQTALAEGGGVGGGALDLASLAGVSGFNRAFHPSRVKISGVRFLGVEAPGDAIAGYYTRDDMASPTAILGEGAGPLDVWIQGGESRSIGSGQVVANTILNPAPGPLPRDAFKLTGLDIRGPSNTTLDPNSLVDFEPAFEEISYQNSTRRETGLTAGMRWAAAYRAANGAQPVTMFAHGHGISGTEINELRLGSQSFTNFQGMLPKIKAIAAAYGRDVKIPSYTFVQGMNDRGKINAATYLSRLAGLAGEYTAAFRAVLGAGASPMMIQAQNNADWNNYAYDTQPVWDIMVAQLTAHETGVAQVGLPTYPLPPGDDVAVHFSGQGYALLGEYLARARMLYEAGGDTQALRPTTITRSGAVITVNLTGGEGGALSLDTVPALSLLTVITGRGFYYRDDVGVIAVASVAITGARQIQVTLASDPGSNANKRLHYATTGGPGGLNYCPGSWGTVCALSADESASIPGYLLHHYLCAFEKGVT